MKTNINGLLQGRITRWGSLAVLLISVGATVGWQSERQYQLGGTFIGTSPGLVWHSVQTPMDPNGRTATLLVKSEAYDKGTADMLASFGANTLTEGVGVNRMISRDTAGMNMIAYAQAGGKALGEPLEIKAIFVYTGTMQFTDPDSAVLNYTIRVYPPSADGLPHGDPIATVTGVQGAAKRVPMP
jgi:hypothetical protein